VLKRICLALACSAMGAGLAQAQPRSAPQPLPLPPATPAARDIPYPGVIRLAVDATDIERRIFRVRETVPVAKAGPMTLLYTRWVAGNHGPSGPLYNFAGLTIRAGGKPVAWTRDVVNVFAFHIDVPRGVSELEIEAQYLTPTQTSEGGALMTPEMLRLQWYPMTLYPAGYFTRQITVEASVRLPPEWQFATALEAARSADGVQTFKPVSFEVLATRRCSPAAMPARSTSIPAAARASPSTSSPMDRNISRPGRR
jgi:predicted metalloprotease with PDZ domain